ncbi:DUF2339 domain-containing protein [Cohnella terricola]|uniref:DUF2339 domain-containing protein n=1 Tax=Cohnella terricola TaxID=1289167 RepID=A0A559JWW2_9BACL|nr:DUF2339 domain-containing protein [Cohnella terricola]TVY04374.1 DUF2339 domain-containing protein [Cohnella terricola]
MEPIIRKHWTSLLGVLFILAAFVTLFKYSVEQGWITDGLKIAFGLLSGAGLCVAGQALVSRKPGWLAGVQILIGLGACILYATFSFAGIYYRLWSPMTVLIGMTAVTAGASAYAFRFDSRLLMNIALAGGLLSPLLMQPDTDQVFTLFLYLLVLNSAFFFLSIAKKWNELRIVAFVGTWIVYATYFVHFSPSTDGVWSMPLRYALAAFVFYLIGFLLSSWKDNLCFDGWNLYLSLANGVLFGSWSIFILQGEVHYSSILALIGVCYLISGGIIYRLVTRIQTASAGHLLGGALMLLLSSSHLGSGLASKPLINVFVWGGIAGALAIIGQFRRSAVVSLASVTIWSIVGFYWFAVTWQAPRGDWFGTFIPFLNWGALSWMLLAAIGFYFSAKGIAVATPKAAGTFLSNLFAVFSHLIVGGLLTVQIRNVFIVYADETADRLLQLSLSVSWGIYALLLCLWGTYRHQWLFRVFGGIVLVLVGCKALFLDLEGKMMLYKFAVLLVLAGISFLITWVNGKWNNERKEVSLEPNCD